MKKNKLGATLLVAAVFGIGAVNAQTINSADSNTGVTTVKYGVSGGYELVIPDEVTVTVAGTTAEVKADKVIIEEGKMVRVTISSTNNWNLINGESSILYSVTKSGNALEEGVVLEVSAGTTTATSTLTFSTTEENIAAAITSGEHQDTVTFTAAVVDNN